MEWVLRIMANLMRPDELGPAEAAYARWPHSCDTRRSRDRHRARTHVLDSLPHRPCPRRAALPPGVGKHERAS